MYTIKEGGKMIANKLNDLLDKHDMTGYRLARITGISDAMIGRYRKGQAEPMYANLLKIAEAFDIEVSELYEGKKNG